MSCVVNDCEAGDEVNLRRSRVESCGLARLCQLSSTGAPQTLLEEGEPTEQARESFGEDKLPWRFVKKSY